MAYIANTAFEVKVTNAVFDETANITGVFQNGSGSPEICSAGFLCVRGDRLENGGYTGIKNKNAYYMKAAGATDNEAIYACNTFNVAQTVDPSTGNVYKIGANTLGLPIPAGERGTYTRIDFDKGDKKYRFGIGNASTTLGENKCTLHLLKPEHSLLSEHAQASDILTSKHIAYSRHKKGGHNNERIYQT